MNDSLLDLPADAPQTLGPYRLLRVLGEGGSGRVYLATQSGTERTVALKVLRSSLYSAEAQSRFKREVDFLAALEHPGVARLYDAGQVQTAAGPLSYIAMEYVRGANLVTHTQSLDLRTRIALLAEVCNAVHYCQGRGVIHRDLKPGNILVDAEGRPRIVDFGVGALATADEQTQLTAMGQVVGTIAYMSPEQLMGNGRPDPRWDVYSLGVIAYLLVSGQLPYPELAGNTSALAAMQALRRQRPAPLKRGDLETVVMKAMSTDPASRYADAGQFGGDLERWMQRLPITARPPKPLYLVRLFVRRHRAFSVAVGVALLSLIVGIGVALSLAAAQARAARIAESRAMELGAVNDFLNRMLQSADPLQAHKPQLSVHELLDSARGNLTADTALSPAAKAQLTQTIGATYLALGEMTPALEMLRSARAQLLAQHGPDDAGVLHNQRDLAEALARDGQVAEAKALFQPLLARSRRSEGPQQRERVQLHSIYYDQAVQNGGTPQERAALLEMIEESAATLGAADALTLELEHTLAHQFYMSGEYAAALQRSEHILPLLPDRGSLMALRLDALRGKCLHYLGRLGEAEHVTRDSLARTRQRLGANHAESLFVQTYLVTILADSGKSAEAEALARGALTGLTPLFGPAATGTLNARSALGSALIAQGKLREAEKVLREGVRIVTDTGIDPRSGGPRLYGTLGEALMKQGRHSEAAEWLQRAAVEGETILGANHPSTRRYRNALLALQVKPRS
ncbi:MAG: serine/threonine-protein kinase [Pseudomonadota bacterium]